MHFPLDSSQIKAEPDELAVDPERLAEQVKKEYEDGAVVRVLVEEEEHMVRCNICAVWCAKLAH